MQVLETCDTRLQLLELIHTPTLWHLSVFQLVSRYANVMYPTLVCPIRVRLRDWQLAIYVSLSTIPPPNGSRGPKGLIQTLSLLL